MKRAGLASLLAGAAALVGCWRELPTPPLGPQEATNPVPVPFVPPAAHVDVVGDPPASMKQPVWVDGQWIWRGRRWVWEAGEWVELDPKKVYAKPIVVRRSDGQLVWFEGTFRDDSKMKGSAPR